MTFQRTVTTPLTRCLSPGVHPKCLLAFPAACAFPIAMRAFYKSCLWILQTLLLKHPNLHPGLLN